ncbi:hypothetical protein P4H32_31985, partial [Bacillus cereus]|nr:hypothetical protein [Bacillus cereus]
MELINKQKLLEWLNTELSDTSYDSIVRDTITMIMLRIKHGTFDDHSTQEEIARLKEHKVDAIERLLDERNAAQMQADDWRGRAIQAEQERDEAQWKALWYEGACRRCMSLG